MPLRQVCSVIAPIGWRGSRTGRPYGGPGITFLQLFSAESGGELEFRPVCRGHDPLRVDFAAIGQKNCPGASSVTACSTPRASASCGAVVVVPEMVAAVYLQVTAPVKVMVNLMLRPQPVMMPTSVAAPICRHILLSMPASLTRGSMCSLHQDPYLLVPLILPVFLRRLCL